MEEWKKAKKEYPLKHLVQITRTNSDLDGKTGFIMGKAIEHVNDFYIVKLDEPTPTHLAVVLTEHCLISY